MGVLSDLFFIKKGGSEFSDCFCYGFILFGFKGLVLNLKVLIYSYMIIESFASLMLNLNGCSLEMVRKMCSMPSCSLNLPVSPSWVSSLGLVTLIFTL